MEAFSFMKFWRPIGKVRRDIKSSDPSGGSSAAALDDPEVELGEGDDSFFELELSLSDFSHRGKKNPEEDHRAETTPFPVSPTDQHFSKNKVIPVEIGSNKPHSPITILKSGPKFRAFSFKKSKSVDTEKSTAMETAATAEKTPRHEKKGSKSLNVRFRIEDGDETAGFSFRKTASIARPQHADGTVSDATASPASSSSKRFFSLIKPFYAKKQSHKENGIATASPASSPGMVMGKERQRSSVPAGIRIVRRHLGKSRSASAAVGGTSPASRVDESFLVQQDGIQSAILHCKRSFHGSRESSLLSRTTSDSSSSLEKLSTSSSEDSYVFSRIASDSTPEKSADRQKISLP